MYYNNKTKFEHYMVFIAKVFSEVYYTLHFLFVYVKTALFNITRIYSNIIVLYKLFFIIKLIII